LHGLDARSGERRPKDGDPRAAFAILDAAGGEGVPSIERANYDAESVAREVIAAGLPAEYSEKLLLAA
jgi:hypothetical protein